VPALVGRPDNAAVVHLPCPEWCTQRHDTDRVVAVEDVWHSSDHIDIELPHRDGSQLLALFQLGLEPYSHDESLRRLFVFAEDGSDCYYLDAEHVEAMCDQGIARLEALRAMAQAVGA